MLLQVMARRKKERKIYDNIFFKDFLRHMTSRLQQIMILWID